MELCVFNGSPPPTPSPTPTRTPSVFYILYGPRLKEEEEEEKEEKERFLLGNCIKRFEPDSSLENKLHCTKRSGSFIVKQSA